ncbi:snoRNA binding domain containing protein [Leishmania donovani]|uniref:Putative snoRNA binding domain family protein n=1 Tax=Leishmania donovani TaxID=5661 RepID=A0A504WWI3_LEIDO|nr:putative snoRNA binding domain family protein [Leishmania donovani]CAJ1987760.1 snoRNA binding domain containing protein [Leishmania donovani]VDZ43647.1 Putative_snoRNA_binding_domain_containing_protein_putative/Pfam:PF01798 [Leishmania donovani]
MSTPNLDALLGVPLAAELVARAGGLLALCKLSDAALRMLGTEEFQSIASSSRAKQLHAGLLLKAPLFTDAFGDEEAVDTTDLKAAQKGAAQLGRKCALVAKADLAGAFSDGSLGEAEKEKLNAAFTRLLAEGKVTAEDTQALAVPFVYVRGDAAKHRRGGVKERKKRESQQESVSVVARATQRVRMGVSEEEQVQQLLQREDIRSEFAKERAQQLLKESRKRAREAVHDEYDDLQNISL